MHLILVRHGISEQNFKDLISGGKSNPDLSKQGVINTEKIANYIDEDQIDLVYSSPLIRAKKTAQILTHQNKEIHEDERLIEMDFGSWEGVKVTPLYQECPDAFDFMGMIGENYIKYAQDGESYDKLVDRSKEFINYLKKVAAGKTVLVVCHGFTVRGLVAAIFGLDPMEITAEKNVGFTEINFDEKQNFIPRLMSFNRDLPAYYGLKEGKQ